MLAKHERLILPIAMVCLTLSVLLGNLFADESRWVSFFEGLLLGLSFALSVFALIRNAIGSHE
jgi:hypothetical protein